jgi:uncharacterized protein (TIRG00374 family)
LKNKKLLWLIKLLVGIALVFLIYQNVYHGQQVWQVFRQARWFYIFICLLLLFPNFFIQFLRWRFLLGRVFTDINDAMVLKSLLFGATLGFVTPGNLGELARALYFKNRDRWVITGLNVIDKFSGIIVFLTFGLLSFNFITLSRFPWRPYIGYPVLLLDTFFIVLLWIIVLHPSWFRKIKKQLQGKSAITQKLVQILGVLDRLKRRDIYIVLGLSTVWFFIIILQYQAAVLVFHDVPFRQTIIAVSATLFTKVLLPVSIGDLGIREGASVYFYSLFGIPQVAAFNAAFIIFLTNFLIPALTGSYFLFRLRWVNLRNSRHIREKTVFTSGKE